MRLKDKFKVEKHLIELLVNIRDIQVASVDLVKLSYCGRDGQCCYMR